MTSANNVRVPPLSPPTAVGSPFVPMVEDSAALHAAEEGPLVGDTPPGLLPPFRVANDYMGASRVSDCSPVGGRVSLFVQKWQVITSDSFILSVIKDGFQISVQSNFPGVIRKSTVTPRDQKVILRIQEEIRDLICKNTIVQINDFPNLCLSPIFVIPKKSGDLRIILNLKEFNLFILTQHFRMETLNVILPQLSASDWAVSIDLKDAYLHIPVHPQSRRFLGFQFMDMTYQYKFLPFGLKDSPWVFTRVVATLVGPPPSSGNSSILLSRRLALSGGVQGAFGASSSNDLAVDSGSGFPCELEEVFPGTAEVACLSRGATGHPEFVGSSFGAQSVSTSVCDSGSYKGLVGFGPLMAEVSRPSRQLCGSSPQLQDADTTRPKLVP